MQERKKINKSEIKRKPKLGNLFTYLRNTDEFSNPKFIKLNKLVYLISEDNLNTKQKPITFLLNALHLLTLKV